MRPEIETFCNFLRQHSVEEIRQGVLHRTELGIEFCRLQHEVLKPRKDRVLCSSEMMFPNKNAPGVTVPLN